MKRTAYAWDSSFLGHFTSKIHPEHPTRADVLNPTRIGSDVPGLASVRVDPHLGLPWTLQVHTSQYVVQVSRRAAQGIRWLDSGDTRIDKDSYDVALRSTSAALSLVDAVAKGDVKNGFAAVRPPGHHATVGAARGFCIFNNVAICARYLQERFDFSRILIVDWDVHPGDGTASIFYEDPTVHVLSLHQDGIFNESVGTADQVGRGPGEGATHNVPLPAKSKEADYLRALEPALITATARCRPDFVLVSCGFDAHRSDPLGDMDLTENSFRKFTRLVKEVAEKHCHGRLASILEGGYNTTLLPRCVCAHLEALMD